MGCIYKFVRISYSREYPRDEIYKCYFNMDTYEQTCRDCQMRPQVVGSLSGSVWIRLESKSLSVWVLSDDRADAFLESVELLSVFFRRSLQ